ncbi:MAG TPA: hypothetical protein VMT36_03125, partial [Candidatus Saccharimonadia bacterium]|nr:hypothetical protein [Candidatus Saccharimonadia bacterium]
RAAVWVVGSALAIAAAAAIALGYAAHPGAQPFEPQDPVVFIGSAAVIAGYGFVFAVLVSRVGENVVGWIFGIVALVLALSNLMWAYVTYATETIPPQLPGVELALLLGISLIPWWTSPIIVLIVCFPDGRPISRAWAWLAIAACLVSIVGSLAIVFGSGPLPAFIAASPLALPGPAGAVLAASGRIIIAVLVAMAMAAVWSLGIRYRAADDTGRLQLKWLVYAGGVLVVCGLIFWIWAGSAYAPGSGASTAVWLVLCCGAIVVPVAASVAILRYRLYDIETIIGRTLVYGGLTAILAGLYAAAIRLFNSLFSTVTGERSDLALVLTTLVLATTFTPIKAWLEQRVAARRGIISEHTSGGVTEPLPANDETLDRIAERAAEIVLRRLAEAPRSTSRSPEPAT